MNSLIESIPEKIRLISLAIALGVAIRERAEDAGIKTFQELEEEKTDENGTQ